MSELCNTLAELRELLGQPVMFGLSDGAGLDVGPSPAPPAPPVVLPVASACRPLPQVQTDPITLPVPSSPKFGPNECRPCGQRGLTQINIYNFAVVNAGDQLLNGNNARRMFFFSSQSAGPAFAFDAATGAALVGILLNNNFGWATFSDDMHGAFVKLPIFAAQGPVGPFQIYEEVYLT